MSTLFASFSNSEMAQKALGALIDQGARPEDISLVAHAPGEAWKSEGAESEAAHAEAHAKSGITTTTGGDAVIGAAKGAFVGVGVGILAALAAIAIPGVGLVLGGGALAAAVAGAAGATAAGAAAGGIAGYLTDQGMGPEVVTHYSTAFEQGGSILAIAVPSGSLLPEFAEQLLAKYGASNIATSNGSRTQIVDATNLTLDPVAVMPTSETLQTAAVTSAPIISKPIYVPQEIVARSTIRPIILDPVTGIAENSMLVDPVLGTEHLIRYEDGLPVYVNPTISEHPVVTTESDTVLNANDPTLPTVTLTGSPRVTVL